MGIKEDSYEMEDTDIGDFYVSMVVRQRAPNYRWEMVIVYGPVQHDKSRDFIAELSRKCMMATLPEIQTRWVELWVIPSKFFMVLGSFIFGVVTPLYFAHLDNFIASHSFYHIQNSDWPLVV
jgi:hypothetical protein